MRIERYAIPQQREIYSSAAAAEQNNAVESRQTAGGDTVTISEEGRQAAIAAQMEAAGISPEAAKKLASGTVEIIEPDWETYQVQSLPVGPELKLYEKTLYQTSIREFEALDSQVRDYYAPMLAKMEGMDANEAMDHLFRTYKLPWLGDVFVDMAELPEPPAGMTKQAVNMAYDQLMSLYFTGTTYATNDPYALGKEGMERLANVHEYAKETARAACEKSQQEREAQAAKDIAERTEHFKQTVERINRGELSGTCLGFMTLG